MRFKLWHSLLGLSILVSVEGLLIQAIATVPAAWAICIFAVIGTAVNMYVAMEVIDDIHGSRRVLMMLSVVVAEFLVFFSFQYWYLLFVEPMSFGSLSADPVSLLLHSTMIFVFNPLNMPATIAAQGLLLINVLGALTLVMFVLQNVSQLSRKSAQ